MVSVEWGSVVMGDQLSILVARLDERLNSFENVMERLAEDQSKLSRSFEKLVESQERLALVENDILHLKTSNANLWQRVEAHDKDHKDTTGKVLFEVFKVAGSLIVGVIVAKYGL